MNAFRRHSDRDRISARKNARRVLAMEPLEGRVVLSAVTYAVTNTNDSGAGSLRQAIIQADQTNAPGSPVTINFASSLASKVITPLTALPLLVNSTNPITITNPSATGLELSLGNSYKADGGDPAGLVNATGDGLVVSDAPGGVTSVTVSDLGVEHASGRAFENHGVLDLNDDTVTYSSNGAAVNYGVLNIANSNIAHNTALKYGGGVNNFGGALTVTNSTFTANNASVQGGGITSTGGSVNISGSTFASNFGNPDPTFDESGGALYLESGASAVVTGSTFTGNLAASGGAISNNGGSLSVSSSTFSGNFAAAGGALYDDGLTETHLNQDTFTGNQAYVVGGAIFVIGLAPDLTHDNVYGNSSGRDGSNIEGQVDAASFDDLIGSGDGLSGITDHPGAGTSGHPQNFIGASPTDQISPIMTQTHTYTLESDSKFSMSYTYTYNVRLNTAKLDLYLVNGKQGAVQINADHVDLHDSPNTSGGIGALTDISFSLNDQSLDSSIQLSQNYDAPTATSVPLATPQVSIEFHTGNWANNMAPTDASPSGGSVVPPTPITFTVDSSATVESAVVVTANKSKATS